MKLLSCLIKIPSSFLIVLIICFCTVLPAHAQRSAYDEAAFLNAAAADGDTLAALQSLKTGLDINFKRSENTALYYAIFFKRNEMVQFLLNHGANPDLKDENGNNALQNARKYGNAVIVAMLEKNRKNPPTIKDKKQEDIIIIKDTVKKNPTTHSFAIGAEVLHSRDRGKTWEKGIVLKIPTEEMPGYLIENEAKTVKNYYDPSFITHLTRQTSWTSFFTGDWDIYLPMSITTRVSNKDVYRIYEGGERLPPLRINANGTYTWAIEKNKILKGKWKANKDAPGIILLNGYKNANWHMYNTSDSSNRKIYGSDYVMIVADKNTARHGFRIAKK